MTSKDIQFHIEVADLAHELYMEAKGDYESVWKGAALGFQGQVADSNLFEICKEQALTTIKQDN